VHYGSSSLRNDVARSWLLAIVRNARYGRFPREGVNRAKVYDDMTHDGSDEGLDTEPWHCSRRTS
jgi:hypothetical protein